ncbi:MAG: DUF1697 domain-containing protein [Actinocatenispora sp.]
MSRQVALLRGINLGTRNRVAMPQLRELLDDLGYGDVRTHLQSGNAVFTAATRPDRTASRIAAALADRLDLDIPVLVRTDKELAAVVAADPLGEVADDPARYLVQFHAAEPDPGQLANLRPDDFTPERYAVRGREIFLWLPNGVHSAKLPPALTRRGVTGTARNWKTVTALLDLVNN